MIDTRWANTLSDLDGAFESRRCIVVRRPSTVDGSVRMSLLIHHLSGFVAFPYHHTKSPLRERPHRLAGGDVRGSVGPNRIVSE